MSTIRGPIFISAISLPVASYSHQLNVLCLVSFACADPRPVAGLVVCGYPVPPSRSGQYRGYGPACLTFVGARLRSPIGLAAACPGSGFVIR